MTQQLPGSGVPMWIAMESTYEGPALGLLRQFDQMRASRPKEVLVSQSRAIWSGIVKLVFENQLEVTGYPPHSYAEHVIGRGLLLQSVPDFDANTLETDVGVFAGIIVRPIPGASGAVAATLDPVTVPPSFKSAGGRNTKFNWTAFDREVVRIGWQDGFKTRRDLTARMKAWASENWQDMPDESTIRTRVKDLCPDDVPGE